MIKSIAVLIQNIPLTMVLPMIEMTLKDNGTSVFKKIYESIVNK